MEKHQQNIDWLNCSFPNFSELKVVKDLSYFDKGQIVMARWNGKDCGIVGPTNSGPRCDKT